MIYKSLIKNNLVLILCFLFIQAAAQDPPFLKYYDHPWVDSLMTELTMEEKVAQSIFMATWSNRDIGHYTDTDSLIRNHKIGGLVFFQGSPGKQVELINHYNSVSDIPLAVALDAEWGAAMRLDNLQDYPYQMTLGAVSDDSLIYRMGLRIAQELKLLGIDINLAPVADINNNSRNPVINYRSFGEDKNKVATRVNMYMKGLQDGGILATAKHFPGHGDTDTDSHHALPLLKHSRERFDSLELYPFIRAIESGIGGIMSAHLDIPSLNPQSNLPSTLSRPVMTDLLKKELGFKGLAITDAMNMKGLTRYFDPGIAEAEAYRAGNDIIEYVSDAALAINSILDYYNNGKISYEQIEETTRKILAFKYWSMQDKTVTDGEKARVYSNSNENKSFIRKLYSNAITVLNNKDNLIPIRQLDKKTIACLAINAEEKTAFQAMVEKYTKADNYYWTEGINDIDTLLKKLQDYDLVIAGFFDTDQRPYRNFGISKSASAFVNRLSEMTDLLGVYFGNPYAIDKLKGFKDAEGLILTYQENIYTEQLAAQLIFGGTGAHGKLPVTINDTYRRGYGIITPGNLRLQYGFPEDAGLQSGIPSTTIDSIAISGIEAGAYPGCEVLIARKGVVFFHKCYGTHTYDARTSVEPGDLFDLASVTKVAAATTGLMVLDSEDLFDPEKTLIDYVPEMRFSDKKDLVFRDILAHQAGLYPWIPYWKSTLRNNGKFKWWTIKRVKSDRYPGTAANGLFVHRNYMNKIHRAIRKSPLGPKEYKYSGLSFFLIPGIIEDQSGEGYEDFLYNNVYHKLGAYDIVFNPFRFYHRTRIMPTEVDTLFRHQLLHGYVHDEGAAMMGGFSGNAGLFATANDLVKLLEMYRREGSYGGEQIIAKEVIREYTTYQFPDNENRRGLGFDKPLIDENDGTAEDYPCTGASPSSFGHSGFTGTFAWVDPEEELSYVFLSNRVYPTRNNSLLYDLNIRTNILQAVYDSI
ncbi:MAG: serine hydrolase [Bacteroidales bacterium]|nr:serine hydrolase [Bacteroidales bacterium]